MRIVSIIYLLLLSASLIGQTTYYVRADGNNSNTGLDTTTATAWATIEHAFQTINGGDTAYFMDRGGVFYETSEVTLNPGLGQGNAGSISNPLHFFNYPGESPIIDFSTHTQTGGTFVGVSIANTNAIKLRGITVQGVRQYVDEQWIAALSMIGNGNVWLDRMVTSDNGGIGTWVNDYDSLWVTNCDSYNNCDSTSIGNLGGRGDGFNLSSGGDRADTLKATWVTGCRSWNNSDDGFDMGTTKQVYMSNNYIWNIGTLDGDGNAIKFAWGDVLETSKRRVNNNLMAFCTSSAIGEVNLNDTVNGPNGEYFNNTVYSCLTGFRSAPLSGGRNCSTVNSSVVHRNNLVYNSYDAFFDQTWLFACAAGVPVYTDQQYCTYEVMDTNPFWQYNSNYSVTAADFLSTDSATIVAQLGADRDLETGALPELSTALQLASGSELIDGGIDVGLPFNGSAPDLGAFESGEASEPTPSPRRGPIFSPNGNRFYHNGKPIFSGVASVTPSAVIADHTVVDLYDDIPDRWIDSVKTKLVWIPGMSHGYGYFRGAEWLEKYDNTYKVDIWYHTSAPAQQDTSLRLGRPGFGAESFYTFQGGIDGTKNTVTNQSNTGNPYDFVWFGWSYQGTWEDDPGGTIDPVYNVRWAGSSQGGPQGNGRWGLDAGDSILTGNSVCMDTYLEAMTEYQQYTSQNELVTKFFYSNGVVDANSGTESGFQRELKNKHIRDYVDNSNNPQYYFIDYADILVHNESGELYTVNWNDDGDLRPHQQIHPDNMLDYDDDFNTIPHSADDIDDHIGDVGTMRLAKAMWWLLARASGWDGEIE